MRASLVAVAGLCLALSVAGCNDQKSGSAAPTTITDAALWDPCTLSDAAIQTAGFDPGSKDTNAYGGPRHGFKGCGWTDNTYFLDIDATAHTMDEVRANTSLKNIHNVSVPGRQAVTYTEQGNSCGVDFPTSKGVVEIIIRQEDGSPVAETLCPVGLKAAAALNSFIPK